MKKGLLLGLLLLGVAGIVKLNRDAAPPSNEELVTSGRIATISSGERVDVADHLDADGWTVIEFGAVW